MKASPAWYIRERKDLDVRFIVSMNIFPVNEWSKEENRITIRLAENSEEDNDKRFRIRMGRIEALKLGEQLVKYGNTKIEGEEVAE